MRRSLSNLLSWVSVVIAVIAAFLFDSSPALRGVAWILAGLAGLIAATTYLSHRLRDSDAVRETEQRVAPVTEMLSDADLTNSADEGVPSLEGAKIIVGTLRSKNKWLSMHLHDCFNAVSVRPDEGVLVIAEGPGEGRIEELVVPLRNVIRFETVGIPIGQRLVRKRQPRNGDGEGTGVESFRPVMARVIIGGINTSYYSVVDLGTSPTPELVPLLRNLPNKEAGIFERKAITSAEDCAAIAKDVRRWVHKVNLTITHHNMEETIQHILQELSARGRLILKGRFLVSNFVDGFLIGSGSRLLRPVATVNDFPITPSVAGSLPDVTNEEVRKEVEAYIREGTGLDYTRGVAKKAAAVAAIKECQVDLSEDEDKKWGAVQGILNERRPFDIIDPIDLLAANRATWHDAKIRHLKGLETIFKKEGIEIHYIPKLPFLSLLFQYETEDRASRYAVAVRDGLNQALVEFLLAHELAHKALHCDMLASEEERLTMRRILFSEIDAPSTLEKEADEFAMGVLFPHSYLADRESALGELCENTIYQEFIAGLDEAARGKISDALRKEMLGYIHRHIDKYQEVKRDRRPEALTLPVRYVEKGNLEAKLDELDRDKNVCWVVLDETSRNIVKSSANCQELFGEDVRDKSPLDLVIEEEVDKMIERAKMREARRSDIYYYTTLKNHRRRVAVYSFPILERGKYLGAVAALEPLRNEPLTTTKQPSDN